MDGFDPMNENGWCVDSGLGKTGEPRPLARLVLENGISGLAVLDEESVIVYANREMAAMTGCDACDLVGRDIRDFLRPESEGLGAALAGKKAPGGAGRWEAVFAGKNGKTRTAEALVMNVKTEGENAFRVISAVDITDHRKMGAELAESERKYRLLVENIEEFFFEQSIEGGFVFFNEAMVRHSGFTRDELGVMTFRDYILPEDWDKVVEFYTRILETGEPASGLLIRGRMKDGSLHYYEVRSNLKTDEKGRKVGFRSYCRDVTAEILYEEDQKKTHEALEAKVMERTRELRDINTALEVLLKKREDDKRALEDRVAFSIKEVIAPHIELLKKTRLDSQQAMYLEMLEQNFLEICSPFMQVLSESVRKLTPTEIQIVNLIKQNKSSKQIAGFLGVSPRTVEFHRDNIRKKLGIKNKKQNLRTFLLSG
jgi:PAS domain S-box-containing protein